MRLWTRPGLLGDASGSDPARPITCCGGPAPRNFEPITFHAMAHCLEEMGRADLAIIYYELACGGQWDQRFGDMHNVARLDYLRFLRRSSMAAKRPCSWTTPRPVWRRWRRAAPRHERPGALIFWNTDGTDVDLHVVEPSGEECSTSTPRRPRAGTSVGELTTGYGPDCTCCRRPPAAFIASRPLYTATDANRASTRTKVLALIYEGWGTRDEKVTVKAVALTGRSESHELAAMKR